MSTCLSVSDDIVSISGCTTAITVTLTGGMSFWIGRQQGQFGYDPRRAPSGVLPGHAANQLTDFACDRRASRCTFSGFPAPIAFESLAVPVNDRFRLNDDERRSPVRPQSRQAHPEGPIAWTQLRPFDRLLEHRHLLSQCQILDGQPGFGNERRSEQQNTRFENAHFHTQEIRK